MNAAPSGVDELDTARLDTDELAEQLAGEVEATGGTAAENTPSATAGGHHRTLGAAVDTNTAPVAGT